MLSIRVRAFADGFGLGAIPWEWLHIAWSPNSAAELGIGAQNRFRFAFLSNENHRNRRLIDDIFEKIVWIVELQWSGIGFAVEPRAVCTRALPVLQESEQFCTRARVTGGHCEAALNEATNSSVLECVLKRVAREILSSKWGLTVGVRCW
jgi:hypothetical protein